jgi:septum formation protein
MKQTSENLSRLILASASPRRLELLSLAGVPLAVIPGETDETYLTGESPEEHVARLARAKAAEVGGRFPQRWVLGADTVVVLDDEVLGKPKDDREAEKMLKRLSGREHKVITGYCLRRASPARIRERTVTTRVVFKALSPKEIRWYLKTGEPFDKAGAYAIQGKAAFMVREISGSYTNVVGLPLCEVLEDLASLKIPGLG